nr:PREDICTED: LOW QUALITY PROTEIN: sperm-associated antigen 11-like [Rhinolophus sinicus]
MSHLCALSCPLHCTLHQICFSAEDGWASQGNPMKVLFLFTVLFCVVEMNSGDMLPGIRNIICLMQHGTCRLFFCNSGEKKAEICSNLWNRCCISNAEEGNINQRGVAELRPDM